MSELCNFSIAWVGECKNKKPCQEHSHLTCGVCGKPATHECDETSSLVCGFLLCDDCEHSVYENGCNYDSKAPREFKQHRRKSEQIYTSWICREDDEKDKLIKDYIERHPENAHYFPYFQG